MFKKIYKSMRLVSLIALILSALMVFSASYYIFNERVEQEVKTQARIIADFLNSGDFDGNNLSEIISDSLENKSLILLSSDGKIQSIYDENNGPGEYNGDILSSDIVIKANRSGEAESEKYASGSLGKTYSYCIVLDNEDVLILSGDTLEMSMLIAEFMVVIVFVGILIFVFSGLISKKVTENIVAPIENTSLYEIDEQQSPYEELKPFITKIAYQSREIKHQIERVKRQKLRLQTVSESMSEGLIVLDKDGNILTLNNSAISFFGVENKDSYKKMSIVSLTGKNTEFTQNIIKALHNNKGSFQYKKDENTYEIFYSPVVDDGQVTGVVILMFDMTDRLRNEQIRTEFTANVSHELKTPLTSIHGYAQLISSGMAQSSDAPVFAAKIEKESKRLISLVEDIIELSNLDEGVQTVKNQFSIRSMILEITENLRLTAANRGIELTVGEGEFQVFADSMRIHQMLYNIIDNAVKYNRDNGRVNIAIGERQIVISDTGIGIPDDCKERIFERFFRVDKSRSKTVNGTGLGLSIVKHIAINNGIKINVESVLGNGTTFTLDFPKIK